MLQIVKYSMSIIYSVCFKTLHYQTINFYQTVYVADYEPYFVLNHLNASSFSEVDSIREK